MITSDKTAERQTARTPLPTRAVIRLLTRESVKRWIRNAYGVSPLKNVTGFEHNAFSNRIFSPENAKMINADIGRNKRLEFIHCQSNTGTPKITNEVLHYFAGFFCKTLEKAE